MTGSNYKQTKPQPGDDAPSGDRGDLLRSDDSDGGWADSDRFSIGPSNLPQVVAADGYANNTVGIALQTAIPTDYAAFNLSLGEVVNLQAFAKAGASATLTSNASSQGLLSLTNGYLTGTYTATLTIDVSAYIASLNASITMHLTDNFYMSLSGTGYVGAALSSTSASGGTVVVTTPGVAATGSSGGKVNGSTFDLARFSASVIDTGSWNMAFVASRPGESLKGQGSSVLTVDTTVNLPGVQNPHGLSFH